MSVIEDTGLLNVTLTAHTTVQPLRVDDDNSFAFRLVVSSA